MYDQGDGTVLRRYRTEHEVELEARAMTWVSGQGVRAPAVHDARGRDLLMERVHGPTMLEDLDQRPWMIVRHSRTLARLQRQVNDLVAPDWYPHAAGVPDGDRVAHLDLHPMNVLLGPDGPVIIDWTNTSRAPEPFDAAMTFVLMSTFETAGVRDRIGQRLAVRTFSRSRGRSLVRDSLADACAYRLRDANVTAGERARVQQLLRTSS